MSQKKSRASGVLLHITSLPGSFGIGDLGPRAYKFIDFLNQSRQQLWQVLPLGPSDRSNSPYKTCSSIAGNSLLISPELLLNQNLLNPEDLAFIPEFPKQRVDYKQVKPFKFQMLKKAWENFQAQDRSQDEFELFCKREKDWLDDYALFMVIKEAHPGQMWNSWEKGIARRQPHALNEWSKKLHEKIGFHKFLQFLFFQQWFQLRDYAHRNRIRIIGDIPFYMAFNSADVWANPDMFELDPDTGNLSLIAGVPPDYFSATGQLWNNPVYNWKQLKKDGFKWWVGRFKRITTLIDIARIDHFRGFQAYWQVPIGETTAINGEWIEAPGKKFFTILKQELGHLPIWAEDLGSITREVEQLRDTYNFPGMKILQFAFDEKGAENPYLPFNYQRNCVVYTGTHDNDTTVGWFGKLGKKHRQLVLEYAGSPESLGIHWNMIRLAMNSVASFVIIPLQDILGLGSDARMNIPGQKQGQWAWRYESETLTDDLKERLGNMTKLYDRAA